MVGRERPVQDLTSQQSSISKNVQEALHPLDVCRQLITAGVDSQSSAGQPAHSSSHAPGDAALCPAYLGITN